MWLVFFVLSFLVPLSLEHLRQLVDRALHVLHRVSPRGVVALLHRLGIHYRGVQWEGGAVDGGSII